MRTAVARAGTAGGYCAHPLERPAGPLDTAGRDLLAGAVRGHRAKGGIVIAATHQVLDWPDAQITEIGA